MTEAARPKPICAVISIVSNGSNLLLVRRANPPDAGLWGFPGGKVEFGETLLDAARRELREETGVEVEPMNVIDALDVFERADTGFKRHFVLIVVMCRYLTGTPFAADDALEARWVPIGELTSGALQLSEHVERLALEAVGDHHSGF